MKTKREINKYSILEFIKIERHLEEMAANGWMLSKAGPFLLTYEKAEPKQVHFSIVFFPKANALDPEPSENLKTMWEFCERTGWKLVSQIGQMQIFCNEEENPVPIETEAWIQVKNIHETAKTNVFFAYGILVVNAIVQLVLQTFQCAINPISWLGASYNIYLSFTWLALGIGCSIELIHYFLWYRKAKRIADEEDKLYLPKSIGGFRVIYLGLAWVMLVLALLSILDVTSGKVVSLVIFWALVVIAVPVVSTRLLKAMKVSAKANLVVTIVLGVVISLLMTGSMFASAMKDTVDIFSRKSEMPLQLSDIKEITHDNMVENFRNGNSILLSYVEGMQFEKRDEVETEDYLSIDYKIITVKMPFVYDLCKNELLSQYDDLYGDDPDFFADFGYKKVDYPIWEAKEVYRRYTGGEARNDFIVCYEDKIVEISFNWDVTDGEIEKVKAIIEEMRR